MVSCCRASCGFMSSPWNCRCGESPAKRGKTWHMAKVKDLQNANQVGWNVVGFCGELDLSPGSLQGTQKFDFQGTCRISRKKLAVNVSKFLFQVFPQSHFQQVEEGNQVDLQPLSQRFRSKFSALRIDQFPHRYLTKEPCGAMCRIFMEILLALVTVYTVYLIILAN